VPRVDAEDAAEALHGQRQRPALTMANAVRQCQLQLGMCLRCVATLSLFHSLFW
jgi:hypothetical protein